MTKSKNINLTFGLKSFGVISFDLDDPPTDFDPNNFGFQFNFRLGIDEKNKTIAIELIVNAQIGEEPDFILSTIETRTVFHIPGLDSMLKEEGVYDIPNSLGVTLFSISLSTTRGAMAVKTEDHILKDYLIPLVNPQLMYDEFLKNRQADLSK